MSTPDTGQPAQLTALTPLPRLDDLPRTRGGGFEPDGVRDAFDAFRRHTVQLQAQLRVLQAAGRTGNGAGNTEAGTPQSGEPSTHNGRPGSCRITRP